MATRMLIDARHSEETRVAVLKGNRIEEFDFESADHRQIKGNIYLAKVTRVEPSLQAAFVDFGGNRHGFLAFSEIHPDYYQIPKDDRDALLAAEAEVAEEEERLRAEEEERGEMPGDEYDADEESSEALAEEFAEDGLEEVDTSDKDDVATIEEGQLDREDDDDDSDDDSDDEDNGGSGGNGRGRRAKGRGRNPRQGKGRSRAKEVDDARARRMELRRRYKIQDVIQRRQVLLVQVVKEERGNKGAALTTYLSLAGRYTVLMPNSSHGGGISRKINSANDRKRLKQIVSDLTLPKSMGLIVRTAGLSRTKPEIKRDFDYLARLWDDIREKTLASSAPALIHSDSDLIKRAIRDIYNREIEEVIVEGEAGYKLAKSFMKMLMPSHARRVKSYSDPVPMFQRYGAEDQLKAMYDPVVQLKSGGYLVINPTEALVSIDINSGRSTKEHGIEQTAVATNLEAAREIARQLRLRDMAGLVVIDFIDMERSGNTRKVERAMKDALKNDRARIQVGRISSFGLMEMSRQRLRTGVLEATTRECPHCDGTGLVRTASSAGLSALRLIEDEAAKGKGTIITLSASTEAAVYLLNQKRGDLMEIEDRYGVTIEVVPEGEDEGAKMAVSSSGPRPTNAPKFEPIVDDDDDDEEFEDDDADGESDESDDEDGDRDEHRGNRHNRDGDQKRRRRRGGRNRSRNNDRDDQQGSNGGEDRNAGHNEEESDESERRDDRNDGPNDEHRGENDDEGDGNSRKKRRRGRRGGRGRKKSAEVTANHAEELEQVSEQVVEDMAVVAGPEGTPEAAEAANEQEAKPKRKPRRRKGAEGPAETEGGQSDSVTAAESTAGKEAEEAPAKPKRTRRKKPTEEVAEAPSGESEAQAEAGEEKPKQRRKPRARKPAAAAAKDAKAQDATRSSETAAPDTEAAKPAPEPVASSASPATAPTGKTAPADSATDRGAEADGSADDGTTAKPRRGWWQRTFGE